MVELKRVVRLEGLSQLGLLKLLQNASDFITYDTELVIVGKRITPEAAEATKKIGIRFIKLPVDMYLEEAQEKPSSASVTLTSPKSWRVVSDHLRIKEASIRRLSIESEVSYG